LKPICFITARGGSRGVPRKNIKLLAGKPLISYTIEKALNSKLFSHVIVSTEDKEIASISKKYGAEIPFSRPKKLASNTASGIDVIIHGIKQLQFLGYDFDVIANLDCTAPFTKIKDIDSTLKLIKKRQCNAVYAVYKQHHNPYFNMVELDSHGFLKISKKLPSRPVRRQDAPLIYQLTGFHIFDVDKLLKYQNFFMPKILPYEISPETGLMIDTKFEFTIAELLIRNKLLPTA